jgi:Uma2 family endonuclease
MSAIEQMSLEEFVRLYETEGAFELIDGERIPQMPPVALHGWMLRQLFLALYNHCFSHQLGEIFTEMPFVEVYSSGWVKGALVPHLMFFSRAKWEAYTAQTPDWKSKPFLIIPDLAVEVVSKNDSYPDIQDKVERYLTLGVQLVWVVDPHRARVVAERSSPVWKSDSPRSSSSPETLLKLG